jgi:thioredoxin reductase (NADPH)
MNDMLYYDVIIAGGGPAGLGAALYASRDRLKTLVIEKLMPGGQINNTDLIENYPGIKRTSGLDLTQTITKQVQDFGCEFKNGTEITGFGRLDDGTIKVITKKNEYRTRAVILSPGSNYRKLGVPGEDEFRNAGAGVSYCGTCDAPFFRGKRVLAVGGGNTALEEAMHLAKFASDVTLVHRRDEFRATKILQEEFSGISAQQGGNLRARLSTVVEAIEGAGKVERAILKNVKTGEKEAYDCDGVFIFVGMVPNTAFVKDFVDLDSDGFIKCDTAFLRTKVPGVFAAGDCRVGAAMQLVTAVADGVNAAIAMKQYFRDPDWWDRPLEDTHTVGGW